MNDWFVYAHGLLCLPWIIIAGRKLFEMHARGHLLTRLWLVATATYAVGGVAWSVEVAASGILARLG